MLNCFKAVLVEVLQQAQRSTLTEDVQAATDFICMMKRQRLDNVKVSFLELIHELKVDLRAQSRIHL